LAFSPITSRAIIEKGSNMRISGLPADIDLLTGGGQLVKGVNRGRIIEELWSKGSISRAMIAKSSGLNKATVSAQVAELIEAGLIYETGTGDSELGRKPVMLELDGKAGFAIGVGISAWNIRLVVKDLAGHSVMSDERPLPALTPGNAISEIIAFLDKAFPSLPPSRYGLLGIGLAVPGIVDTRTELVVRSAHMDWNKVELAPYFTEHFNCPVHVANDANMATVAEELSGVPDGDRLCILVDEGIGAGILMDGKIYSGPKGFFGEVGHMTFVHGGRPCPCGNKGCWDAYASERALVADLSEAMGGGSVSLGDALAKARAGDIAVRAVFESFADFLASGIIGLANVFAPTSIIVNSEVLSALPELFDRIQSTFSSRAMAYDNGCSLKLSTLGHWAPALGACETSMARFLEAAARDLDSLRSRNGTSRSRH
jgi:predicted NBD/HSP70 family sugar kinase